MRDHLTVKAVSYNVRRLVGLSKCIEKLRRYEDACSTAIDGCSYSLQFSVLIPYLDFVDNVR